jgi:hypothetical protein
MMNVINEDNTIIDLLALVFIVLLLESILYLSGLLFSKVIDLKKYSEIKEF